ncbi:mCG1038781, partial [Mus musculus]
SATAQKRTQALLQHEQSLCAFNPKGLTYLAQPTAAEGVAGLRECCSSAFDILSNKAPRLPRGRGRGGGQ